MKIRKTIALALLTLPFSIHAQTALSPIIPSMYSWKAPQTEVYKNVLSTFLFEGSAEDMEYLRMNAVGVKPAKTKTDIVVPLTEEHLLLIKEGVLTITFNDSTWSITPGSVAVLLPGQNYAVQNKANTSCTFYEMRYRARKPIDVSRARDNGGSFVKDWNKIKFKPHERGGIRNYFEKPTAMCKRLEMHVTTLNEGIKSHEPHTHRAEEIVLVIDNKTEMQIGEKFYKGGAGDIYYLGSNVLHAIRNDGNGSCTYFAFQFE